ncbi:hypothetical protein JW872_01085 [Candidatus Babeliales bacterium]|nr:hypothetical protein [Candidatus Babeliales bacterium]
MKTVHILHYLIFFSITYLAGSSELLPKKEWTFMVYMAARNDLHPFSHTNIRQMADIGSNEFLNIIVNLDERGNENPYRLYIEKDNPLIVCKNSCLTNSGDPENLIDFCKWAIEAFPAQHYALILWDHGTGPIDPFIGRTLSFDTLLTPEIFEIQYKSFLGLLPQTTPPLQKGICFDDEHRQYITNEGLQRALSIICQESLNGGKLDIIGFDACLMSDIAIAHLVRDYANIMVSSQNVELGPGWNYRLTLKLFTETCPTPKEFATHMVQSYGNAYQYIIGDYTQSAIDLQAITLLENNVHHVSTLLTQALHGQHDRTVKDAIKMSRSRRLCTAFDEPSYIDLHHLYLNLSRNLPLFQQTTSSETSRIQTALYEGLTDGMKLIESIVIANTAGSKLPNAKGISIYFPEVRVHSSYYKIPFALENKWLTFVRTYLNG